MKKNLIFLFVSTTLILIGIGAFLLFIKDGNEIISPVIKKITEKPLDRYSFEKLKITNFQSSKITIGERLKNGDGFSSYIFYFNVEKRRVSGLINIPNGNTQYPVVIMIRGFVDPKIYKTGVGTSRGGEIFAKNGFITLAPDFLGYGESDNPSIRPIEERFQTYTTVLTLLESLTNLNSALRGLDVSARVDMNNIGIWAHSNGGQIAISVLEITGKKFPTVLWAPVSKPFPYSILYFTDEFDDQGKALRRVVAKFEEDYNVFDYSPELYYGWIEAPIQLHQGDSDDAIPLNWSNSLADELRDLEKDIEYFVYPGADHNLLSGWDTAISRSINFYKKHFE